jgi:hypothetical protein
VDEPRPERTAKAASRPGALPEGIRWCLSFSVMAYGVQIRIRSNTDSVIDAVLAHLPPGSTRSEYSEVGHEYAFVIDTDASGKPRHSLYINNTLYTQCRLPELLHLFETEVQLHVAEMAPDRVFVHAGAVGWNGRAIVIPGRTFTGKSTLVAALVRAGADYYSDEYAVLDSSGNVHPYARPLSIRPADGTSATKITVDTLRGRPGATPIPVGLIVVSQFKAGTEWRPERLTAGRAMLALFANTVPARRIPNVVLPTLHQIVEAAIIVGGDRGEAAEIVKSLLDLAERN